MVCHQHGFGSVFIRYGSRFFVIKIWKNLQLKKNWIIFWIKTTIYLSLGLHKGRPSYIRSLQLSKENIQHFKTWNFLGPLGKPPALPITSTLCRISSHMRIRIRIRFLWPDWIRIQSGSGSETLATSWQNTFLVASKIARKHPDLTRTRSVSIRNIVRIRNPGSVVDVDIWSRVVPICTVSPPYFFYFQRSLRPVRIRHGATGREPPPFRHDF